MNKIFFIVLGWFLFFLMAGTNSWAQTNESIFDTCKKENIFYEIVKENKDYSIVKIKTKDVPHFLKCGNRSEGLGNNIDDELKGVYWMKGNPMPDDYALVNSDSICVYGDQQWTFHSDYMGSFLHEMTKVAKLTYKFDFAKKNNWSIIPQVEIRGMKINIPKWYMSFTAERDAKEELLLRRRNWIGPFEVMGYDLYKVLDKDGVPTKFWKESLEDATEYVYIAILSEKK